jgi:hypothetical protein
MRIRNILIVGIAVAAVLFVCVSQVFPQTLRMISPLLRVPYTVDSVFLHYSDDGSSAVNMYDTEYHDHGREVELSSSVPGHPFATAIRRTMDVVGFAIFRLKALIYPQADPEDTRGCVESMGGGTPIGLETILNYPTAIAQVGGRPNSFDRITLWLSPDLGCFPLKLVYEEHRPDNTFHRVWERHAVKVTINR